jgi:tetratricopeptide (TPR) repeat protein
MTKVAEEDLLNQPRMQSLRRGLLDDALEFYQQLIARRGDDSELNRDLALAYARVGKIYEQQGELLKSVEPQREAVRRLRSLVAANNDRTTRLELGKTLSALGITLNKVARRADRHDADFKEHLADAISTLKPLYEQYPEDLEIGEAYCGALHDYAISIEGDAAKIRCQQALEVAESLVRRSPNKSLYRFVLATALEAPASIEGWAGSEENERRYRQSIAIMEELVAAEPENVRYAFGYALSLHNFANVLTHLRIRDEARRAQVSAEARAARVKCVEICKRLWNDFPENPEYGAELGLAHMHLANSLSDDGERDAAIAEHEAAVEVLRQVVKKFPDDAGHRNMLGFWALNNLIDAYMRNGEFEKELAARKTQIQLIEATGRDMGTDQSHWNHLVLCYCEAGDNALLLGRDQEGIAAFDAAERNAHAHLQNAEYDAFWIILSIARCESFIKRGRLDEAREIARELIDHFPLKRLATELQEDRNGNYPDLARFLAVLPWDDLRRPHELTSIFEESLQALPELDWDSFSVALLAVRNAAGDYAGARQVLEQAEGRLGNPKDDMELYSGFKFLGAQVLWNLGEKDAANRMFDEGLEFLDWLGERGSVYRLHREVAALLQITDADSRHRQEQQIHRQAALGELKAAGELEAARGNYAEAARQYQVAAQLRPADSGIAIRVAALVLVSGDRQGYEEVCRVMLEHFGRSNDVSERRRTCWACLLSSPPVGDLELLVELADSAARSETATNLEYRERGLAAYRAGDWEGALHWSNQNTSGSPGLNAPSRLVEAMALYRINKPTEASAHYQEAVRLMERSSTFESVDFVTCELLRREAETLLQLPAGNETTEKAAP